MDDTHMQIVVAKVNQTPNAPRATAALVMLQLLNEKSSELGRLCRQPNTKPGNINITLVALAHACK